MFLCRAARARTGVLSLQRGGLPLDDGPWHKRSMFLIGPAGFEPASASYEGCTALAVFERAAINQLAFPLGQVGWNRWHLEKDLNPHHVGQSHGSYR